MKFVMQKILLHVKQRLNPNIMHQLTTPPPPPAESHCLLLEKLKELHYRVNIFVTIGIPYLVKSMQAVHGDPYMRKQLSKIKGVQRCSTERFENA